MTWEGGMRVPAIFRWPGKIEPAVVTGIGSTLDLFTTFSALAGEPLPDDRTIDGLDLSPALLEGKASPRNSMLYYRGRSLYAARLGDFKAHYIVEGAYGMFEEKTVLPVPQLYNLSLDPAEEFDVADQHPEVLEQIEQLVDQHRQALEPGEDQLADREGL